MSDSLTIEKMVAIHDRYQKNLTEHEKNRKRMDDALNFQMILDAEMLRLRAREMRIRYVNRT